MGRKRKQTRGNEQSKNLNSPSKLSSFLLRIMFVIYKTGAEPQAATEIEQQQPPAQAMQLLNLGSRQFPAGPQAPMRPSGPQNVQQQRQPGPGQQAMQQQRPNVPTTYQLPQGMAQRPGVPQQPHPAVPQMQQPGPAAPQGQQPRPAAPQGQQPRPAAPHGQQPRPAASQATQPRSITPQTHRLVAQGAALRPPPRSAAGGEGTLGRPIKLSANHFAVTMKKQILYHYDVEIKPLPPKTLFKYCFYDDLILLIGC